MEKNENCKLFSLGNVYLKQKMVLGKRGSRKQNRIEQSKTEGNRGELKEKVERVKENVRLYPLFQRHHCHHRKWHEHSARGHCCKLQGF